MPIQAIKFGNLSAVKPLQVNRPAAPNEFAQNFKTNFGNGELVPKVQNEVLANKLDVFA